VSGHTRVVAFAAGALVLAMGGYAWLGAAAVDDEATASDAPTEVHTATVERRDLARTASYDGTLGYGDEMALPGSAMGTITGVPDEGAVIDFGEELYEVDGKPVVLLPGEVPAYRRLAYSEGPGDDVRQLEQFLADAGFGDEGLVTDTEWTGDTTEAVQRWQESLGLAATGEIEVGQVVFWPTPVRVESHAKELGSPADGSVLSVTGTSESVTVDVDADERERFAVGDVVAIELADGTRSSGTVTEVGQPESSSDPYAMPGAGSSTASITIALDDTTTGGASTDAGASVEVHLTLRTAEDVLAVPVSALLALAEGGYAVEVDEGAATRLVGVKLGLFADSSVEVTPTADGQLAEGDEVVVP
jgi:peptidoglycan hydrolase-like protein with peptidoglycan-binding domain